MSKLSHAQARPIVSPMRGPARHAGCPSCTARLNAKPRHLHRDRPLRAPPADVAAAFSQLGLPDALAHPEALPERRADVAAFLDKWTGEVGGRWGLELACFALAAPSLHSASPPSPSLSQQTHMLTIATKSLYLCSTPGIFFPATGGH